MSNSVTSKFKKGDKVVCVSNTSARGVEFDKVYIVKNPSRHTGFYWDETHNHVSLEEVDSTPSDKCLELYIEKRNYREMKPTDLITISIDGDGSEVPLGDLVHATRLLGITNGRYGASIWEALYNVLGEGGFVLDDTIIEFRDKQKEALDYFFKPHYDKQQQEKEELCDLISAKQKEIDLLREKLGECYD